MSASLPNPIALLSSFTVSSVARRRPRQTAEKTTSLHKKQSHATVGFGGRNKDELWRCVEGCGACCKLHKGPSFPSPQEIFTHPSDVEVCLFLSFFLLPTFLCMTKPLKRLLILGISLSLCSCCGEFQLYESLIGPDGWCVHSEKSTRTCSIYAGNTTHLRSPTHDFHNFDYFSFDASLLKSLLQIVPTSVV